MEKEQVLRLSAIVKQEYGRYAHDGRRKVNRVIASYIGQDGFEYRKGFASYGEPIVPKQGTHKELNRLQEQFVAQADKEGASL